MTKPSYNRAIQLALISLAMAISACVPLGTHTWPGVDVLKADAFREALYAECKHYTNTHNMLPDETLDDLQAKKFWPEDVTVSHIYDAPEHGSLVSFHYRGWNYRFHVDFQRGLMKCDQSGDFHASPSLQKYHFQ